MSFEDWASNHSNQYVHHFSSNEWNTGSYYNSYLTGFRDRTPLNESHVKEAVARLSSTDMHVIWLDEIGSSGWKWLAAALLDTPANAAGVLLAQWLSGNLTTEAAAGMENVAHVNHNSDKTFLPTAAQKQVACEINARDCELYAALRSATRQTCACE